MARPIVAVSSVVVGCVALVVVARLTARRAPPPLAGMGIADTHLSHSAGVAHRIAPAVAPLHIELPRQVITASLKRRRRRAVPAPRRAAAPAPRRKAKVLAKGWPCSPWRALGPVHSVHEGEKPRQRYVRSLCFGPRPRPRPRPRPLR